MDRLIRSEDTNGGRAACSLLFHSTHPPHNVLIADKYSSTVMASPEPKLNHPWLHTPEPKLNTIYGYIPLNPS